MRRQAKAPSAFSFIHSRLVASLALICLFALPGIASAAPGPPAPNTDGRAYELVSPAFKESGNGAGISFQGGGPRQAVGSGAAAHLGERFAVAGHLGNVLLDGAIATASDWALAKRVSDDAGWQSHSPVTHSFKCSENYRMQFLQASSPDLSTLVWAGNNGDLPIFEEMCAMGNSNSGSSMLSDWGNPPLGPTRWEPIGPLASWQRAPGFYLYFFDLPTVSADGSHLALAGYARGLAGPTDPTIDTVGDSSFETAQSAYIDDISAGISDSWPGNGVRTPAAACTGTDGGPGEGRTRIPVRNADGSLAEAACGPAQVGRDSRLISDYGSAFVKAVNSFGELSTSNVNVISTDGARAFFMAPDPNLRVNDPGAFGCVDSAAATKCPPQLYVRQENADGEVVTRWISRPEAAFDDPGQADLLGPTYFEGASADGSVVFFRTASPLTADDPNGATQPNPNLNPATQRGPRSWDLYMFELAPGPDGDPATPDGDPTGPGSQLTRITGGLDGTSDCGASTGGVSSSLRLSSEDGRRVYFSCAAPLGGIPDRVTGTAAGTQGGLPSTADQVNVYRYEATEPNPADRYSFVARIPSAAGVSTGTNEFLTRCASTAAVRGQTALQNTDQFQRSGVNCWRGSEDGSFVTFWTLGRLTPDDPDEFAPGQLQGGSADIYAYSAESDELARVSAPRGSVDETYPCGDAVTGTACYASPGIYVSSFNNAAPAPPLNVATDSASGEHSVFFESKGRLLDADQNTAFDVYRWHDGDLSLISPGAPDSDGVTYRGNSADGKNVYLATRDKLTWQDVDGVLDVYTARAGSAGIPEPPPPTLCAVLNDACQSPGNAAPGASGAASTAFAGAGNVASSKPRKCRKGRVRRGTKCVKRKSAKRKAAKQKNRKRAANQAGRAHR